MACFAANSLLCRAALGEGLVDAASFTAIRILSGALALALLARRGAGAESAPRALPSAAALFVYAFAFSAAYTRIPAALGALLLFGAVQVTMVGRAVAAGERPAAPEWAGLLLSVSGLLALTIPGIGHTDLAGSVLMIAAGVAWGVYSLLGRSGRGGPLASNAASFARAVPLALLASFAAALLSPPHVSPRGLALAVASGALASACGYALWFAAMRELSATQAGLVQLSVPPLAALGGVVLLGEAVTVRLALSALVILGGIALAIAGGRSSRV